MDSERFWKLLEPLYSQAECFARHMAPRAWDDVLQDSLLKALKGLESLRQEELFKYWLFRIIANEARRAYRRDFWRKWLPMPGEGGDATDGLAEVYFTVASALQGESTDINTLAYARMAEYLAPEDAERVQARLLSCVCATDFRW